MLLGFKKKFAPKIINGSKIHTVRNFRKVKPKLGETLYMYTGLRTRNCELITNKETLKGIDIVRIYISHVSCEIWINIEYKDQNSNNKLNLQQMEEFAINDGFDDLPDFIKWWMDGYNLVDFRGNLLHWTNSRY
jgi:hypothetical protein